MTKDIQTTKEDTNIPSTEVAEFNNDIEEFKIVEKEVIINFTNGIIKLGEILKRQRDKWKPKKRWMEYLTIIDKTLPNANQCVRYYEYSINNMPTLLKVNLNNWHKMNMFLALPEEQRDKMAESIDGKEVTTDEFIETINEVKDEDIEIPEEEDGAWQELVSSASFSDIPFMAKELLKQLNNNGYNFSNNCLGIIEGFLGLGKANKELKKENFKLLTAEEKKFWKKQIADQLEMLNKLLK